MTDSPSVTWPSPARTTLPLRRMDKTVVDRISRFVDMGANLDYSSAKDTSLLSAGKQQQLRQFCNSHRLRPLLSRPAHSAATIE